MKRKTKNTLKTIAMAVLGVGAIVGGASLINNMVGTDEDLKTIHPIFEVGGLNETGGFEETDKTIYTKDAFECQGLEIKLDFDNTIDYQVFFYESDGDFVSASELLSGNKKFDVPLTASHARIEITPTWSEMGDDYDTEKEQVIKWYQTSKYSSQMEIKVNKEQEELNIPYEGNNQFVYNEAVDLVMGNGTSGFASSNNGNGAYNATNLVSTINCSNICIKIDLDLLEDVKLCMFTETGYISGLALSKHDYQETIFGGDLYITLTNPTECEGICLYSEKTVNFSNVEIYVW